MSLHFIVTTKSVDETEELGKRVSRLLNKGDVICLIGDLGTGKTAFVRGVCAGLDCKDVVSSPTFTIINEYQAAIPVYHFDFYRLADETEIYGLGYEEYFYDDGICLIEWAERAKDLLPRNRIEIHLTANFERGKQNWRRIAFWVQLPDSSLEKWKQEFSGEEISENDGVKLMF